MPIKKHAAVRRSMETANEPVDKTPAPISPLALPPGLSSGGKAKKRRLPGSMFVRLNQAICKAADEGAEPVLQLVQNSWTQMNLVNYSTALHRMARLSEDGKLNGVDSLSDARFVEMLAGARAAFFENDEQCKARCLSNIAWSIARLGVDAPAMMQDIADLALPRIREFKPYELGILLWSFAKLQIAQTKLFSAACDHIRLNLDTFGAACLATLVWSLTTAKIPSCADLIRRAADMFALRLKPDDRGQDPERVKPVALENMMWGLATSQVWPHRKSLLTIADAALLALREFKVHEFTIMLWSFARLGVYHEGLFSTACDWIQRSAVLRNNLHPQGLSNLLWAFARHAEKHGTLQFDAAITVLLPVCQLLLPQLKPQELGCMLRSLSKLGTSWGEDKIMDRIFVTTAWSGMDSDFFNGHSLRSAVNMLAAYARFMGHHHGQVDPFRGFVMNLIAACANFESDFCASTLLSIVEALPHGFTPTPPAQKGLETIVCAMAHQTNSFPQSTVSALADLLGGNANSLHSLTTSSFNQVVDDLSADRLGRLGDPGWPSEISPAYTAFTCESWLKPELVDCDPFTKFCSSIEDEPAYVMLTHVSGVQPATLMILEEYTMVFESTVAIMFEVNSDAAFEMCNIVVECYCNGLLYDCLDMLVEAGDNITNTQTLTLVDLQKGEHEIHFTLRGSSCEVQHSAFHFFVPHDTSMSSLTAALQQVTSPAIIAKNLEALDESQVVKARSFGSGISTVSTYVAATSYSSDACDSLGDLSDEGA